MLNIKQKVKVLILSLVACYSFSNADIGIDLNLGSLFLTETGDANLDFNGHIWYKFDQMIFIGVGGGVQKFGQDQSYPLLASLLIRLPIGGQILPVATGDWGYSFGSEGFFQWRAGGGLDIKCGDRSSIMIFSGYQSNTLFNSSAIYGRAGILLEF